MHIHPKELSIEQFDYVLPNDKIASYPLEQRDSSKLLIYRKGHITERTFKDLPHEIESDSLLVFNDTKVIQARLSFIKKSTGAKIEIFVLESATNTAMQEVMQATQDVQMTCMIGNSSKWKDEVLQTIHPIKSDLVTLKATKVAPCKEGHVVLLSWNNPNLTFAEILDAFGAIPLPPYLGRNAEETDKERYQTVYAAQDGSVAAPTAGLHFTPQIFENLTNKGVKLAQVTLHVGAGTFKPVKSAKMETHEMHREMVLIDIATLCNIKAGIGKNIIAVGTTSIRTIESLYWFGIRIKNGWNNPYLHVSQWDPYEMEDALSAQESLEIIINWMEIQSLKVLSGYTSMMIAPGYKFKLVNQLITNFHQPKSTLLLLVSAFTGGNHQKIYDYALNNDFRFLSFGDSSLLVR